MPVYDVLCETCGEKEIIAGIHDIAVPCATCGKPTRRLIGSSRVNCANEDEPWIRSVTEIVDKDSKKPHIVEFLKRPTRYNYKVWMREEGFRHLEPGEKNKPPPVDTDKLLKQGYEKHRKRLAIEVR